MTLTVCVVGASMWLIGDVLADLPSASQVRGVGSMPQATILFDAQNRPAFTIYEERRIEVPLSQVSPHVLRAIVAVEDQRFYGHRGVDVVRIVAAALNNLRARRAVQGGSTLTQQLARQSFLPPDKTLRRKLREAVLASWLEREFTKDQILEMYLNKVYFGDGLYGVEAASLGFFGKHARDLGVSEAAMLAGVVKSPSTSAPTVNFDRALARRNVVLGAMRENGAIDAETYERALRTRPHLASALPPDSASGPYFKEEVRKQLVQRFGWERVSLGGLRVYTTIDVDIQREAEAEVAKTLADIERRQLRSPGRQPDARADPLQASLVAVDPLTGEVRAMVGGRSFDQSHFNRATQARRQAGSAFKPFIYAAALEQGFTPATAIDHLDSPVATPAGEWIPADERSAGAITMRDALRTSSNRAAVQMLRQVGIPTALRYAARFGIDDLPAVPSLALGSGGVTLLSMTSAYAAFANDGMVATPILIRRVEDASGHTLFEAGMQQQRAVSEATAFIMTSMMSDVINAGTGRQARSVGFKLPAAGKTGTTNDFHDVWFVGFTPHLATGVWIGYDQPRTILARGYAGDLVVPLWGRFMALATRNDRPDRFVMPATVVQVSVCRVSGQLATAACRSAVVLGEDGEPTAQSTVYTEYFVRGTEPSSFCPLSHTDSIDATTPAGEVVPPAPESPDQPAAPEATPAPPAHHN